MRKPVKPELNESISVSHTMAIIYCAKKNSFIVPKPSLSVTLTTTIDDLFRCQLSDAGVALRKEAYCVLFEKKMRKGFTY